MTASDIVARTILRRHRGIDSWFISWGGMNLYRGCAHNCVYCDGRSEKYRVDGDFSQDLAYKSNAPTVLAHELDPKKKRNPFPGGYLLLGGGVGDLYQPIESQLSLTRQVLKLIQDLGHPVHVLTKSITVDRDRDILMEIARKRAVLVSFSFSTTSDTLAKLVEPGCPPPGQRLKLMAKLNQCGIPSGAFLMPVLPGLSDQPDQLNKTIGDLRDAGCRYLVFSGLTLKEGRQKNHYMSFVSRYYPRMKARLETLYPPSPWGGPMDTYRQRTNTLIFGLAEKYRLPKRIPLPLFASITSPQEATEIVLQQLVDLSDIFGESRPFSAALHRLRIKDENKQPGDCSDSFSELFQMVADIASGRCPDIYRRWIGGLI